MGAFDDIPTISQEEALRRKRQDRLDRILGRGGELAGSVVLGPHAPRAARRQFGTEMRGLLETTTAGIPREVIKRKTGLDIGRGGAAGQAGGLILGGGALRNLLIKAGLRGGAVKGLTRGAITGAGASQLIAPEEDFLDPTERGVVAGIGAAGGPIIEGGTAGVAKTLRTIRKVSRRPEVVKRTIDRTKEQLKTTLRNLDEEIQTAAEKGSIEFKPKLIESFRKARENYGEAIDKIEGTLTNRDIVRAIDKTLDTAEDIFINPEDPALKTLRLMRQQFMSKDADTVVSVKKALELRRRLSLEEPSGVRRGTQPFGKEDITSEVFRNEVASSIRGVAPEIQALNAQYARFLEAQRFAFKTFKPRLGPTETKAGTQLLKRTAETEPGRGLEAGERRALTMLEEGEGLLPGAGRVSKPLRELGRRKEAAQKETADRLNFLSRRLELSNRARNTLNVLSKVARFGLFAGASALVARFALNVFTDREQGGGGGGQF